MFSVALPSVCSLIIYNSIHRPTNGLGFPALRKGVAESSDILFDLPVNGLIFFTNLGISVI